MMENIIKNNKFINLIFFHLGSLIFKTMGLFIRINPKRILLSSGMGNGIFDSPLVIYNQLKADLFFNDYEMIWAVKEPEKYNDGFNVVKIDTFKYFYYCLSSKVWITSVNIERGLKFKKHQTIYINTWHGVPLKHVGLDVKNRNDYNFSHVDIFLSSGLYESKIYKSAFNLKSDQIKVYGNPRNISLYESINNNELKKERLIELGLSNYSYKKIVLFAPTWKDYQYEILDLSTLADRFSDDYIFMVKSHPLEKIDFNNSKIIDVSYVSDIALLLPVTDILISDYSSVMIDYSIFNRPIISYIPDFDYYNSTRGLYLPKEELAPNYFETTEAIINFIENINLSEEELKVKEYSKKFLSSDPKAGLSLLIEELKERLES